MEKPTVAIFDLTDCEGCESMLLTLGDEIEAIAASVEFVNFRLGTSAIAKKRYNVTFIEGYVMNDDEADLMRQIRENTDIMVALGSGAVTGGVPAMVPDEYRQKWFQEVYGDGQPRICDYCKALDEVIPIDVYLDGCPIPVESLRLAITAILHGRVPNYKGSTVCQECKAKGNKCVLLEGKPCLGGVTRAGCGAMCPSNGKPCVGCFRPVEGANMKALAKMFKEKLGMSDVEIWKKFQMYNVRTDQFKEIFGEETKI